jgi:glycosyltransferase involved in cell wall biosynthesis
MRILIASSQWFPDRESGLSRVVTETARRLAQRGHVVTALVPRAAGEPVEVVEGSLTIRRVIGRGRLPQSLTDLYETARHARRQARDRYDLALGHGPDNVVGLRWALPGVPVGLVFHACHSRELAFERAQLPLGKRRLATTALQPVHAALERLAMRHAEPILVLSEFSRSIIEEDHPAALPRVRRVLGGVDTGRFSPDGGQAAARARLGLNPSGRLLLTVRRLEPRMGIDELLRALPQLAAEQAVELAIVGAGPLERQLRRLAAELGVADLVRFAGRVDDAHLPDWYRAADVFVLPTVAYEGFGMVTAEALAAGTPVVGTPIGATPELLAPLDPLLVADSADAAGLARAIAYVLERAGPELSRRCREYALERFAWDRTIEVWERALVESQEMRPGGAGAPVVPVEGLAG